jgi:phenylacetate-coenzyme A ligase PaaK-like adenylate-forming protein
VSAASEVMEVLLDMRRQQPRLVVVTTPSGATRLAGLALQSGVSLDGVTFVVQSEPLTPGKHAAVVRTGARAYARYGLVETGSVAEPCPNAADVDTVHFMADCFGLVRDRRALPDGTAVDALLLTTLLPSSPKILLNVETDDFADVTTRRCGCLWEELGMKTCLSNIRSFSKLTGEGMTILGTDCVRILDEVLPEEFGGQSTDYQLLEVEDHEHLTRLRLVVSPSVGPVDEHRLLQRFIDELRKSIQTEAGLPPLWQQADSITVLRQEPVPTASGKLFPFHTQAIQAPRSGHPPRSR